jgi:hypothetical protein
VVKDRNTFVGTLETLADYLVEFNEDGTIKDKAYPLGCEVYGSESRPIILVTHDEATFSANDGICRAWMDMNGEATYLRPKTKGQGIMVSEFLLPFGRLNLSSLTAEQKTRIMEPTASGLTVDEAVEILEYGKNREGYWDGAKLLEQVVNKALPIAEALFPGYSLFFLFDNATSHSVYAEDALRTTKMNTPRLLSCRWGSLRAAYGLFG